MEYEYDVFLSYRRYGEWPEWVSQKFMPLFKHYLGEELGCIPKIFFDVESIETGISWPARIQNSLARSRVIVPLFSKQYFSSEWCRHELAHMLARENKCGFATRECPEGLIIPAKIHDGKDFPFIIKNIQCLSLEHCSNVRVAKGSPREEELSCLIEKWMPDIVSAIERAPEYDKSWQELLFDEIVEKLYQKPNQVSLPRLI